LAVHWSDTENGFHFRIYSGLANRLCDTTARGFVPPCSFRKSTIFSGDREGVCLPTIWSKQESMDTSSLKTSEKVVLSPTEFASLFGRHYTWGYRQIYAGKVKVITNLGRIMIPRSEVDRLLQQTETYTGKK